MNGDELFFGHAKRLRAFHQIFTVLIANRNEKLLLVWGDTGARRLRDSKNPFRIRGAIRKINANRFVACDNVLDAVDLRAAQFECDGVSGNFAKVAKN